MRKDIYESPLSSRYASEYMLHLFSPDMRFQTWRRLWVALARAEHELGLPITQEQVDELAAHITDIDYDAAAQREREVLYLILLGKDNQNIASEMSLALSTVKVHVHNILKKTGDASRQELIQNFWKMS